MPTQRRQRRRRLAIERLEDRRVLATIYPGAYFEGPTESDAGGFFPADPTLAAGPGHLLYAVNSIVQWRTKSGLGQGSDSLFNFFAAGVNPDPPNFVFDPKVLYDAYAQRFVVVAVAKADFGGNNPANISQILIAVSDDADPNPNTFVGDPDPTSSWYFHAIDAVTRVDGDDTWADYPAIAVDNEALYVSLNMFTFGSAAGGDGNESYGASRLWIVPKQPYYAGGTPTSQRYNPAGLVDEDAENVSTTLQPAQVFGTQPSGNGTYLVSFNGDSDIFGDEFLHLIRVSSPNTAPLFTYREIDMGNIDDAGILEGSALPSAPQPGGAPNISTGSRRVLSAVWRDSSLWIAFGHVPDDGPDEGESTAHWLELRFQGDGTPYIHQRGNIGGEALGAGTRTYFPNLTVDASGNMGMSFAASNTELFVGAYFTGRTADDPLGATNDPVTLQAGLARQVHIDRKGRNRWGDYSGMAIDPVDGATFWSFNMYALSAEPDGSGGTTSTWATALGSFSFAGPPPRLAGQVWHDVDTDGVIDPGEPGIANRVVYLDLDDDGTFDTSPLEPFVLTGADGRYAFENIGPSTYSLGIAPIANWQASLPTDSTTYVRTVWSGHDATELDFGQYTTGAIAGVVYEDTDRDGQRDGYVVPPFGAFLPTEPGLAGWRVVLDRNINGFEDGDDLSQITPTDGSYEFAGLAPGLYHVLLMPRPGFQTIAPQSLDYLVELHSAELADGLDFGESSLAVLRGHNVRDLNRDRQADAGEPDLANWEIFVDRNLNGLHDEYDENLLAPGSALPIPKLGTTMFEFPIQGLPTGVRDLDVRLDLQHAAIQYLTATLVSPEGERVRLFSGIGGNGHDLAGAVLDDEAAESIGAGADPFSGHYRPLENLSRFDYASPNGIWRLELVDSNPDEFAPDGVLFSWSLRFHLPEPSDVTDLDGQYQILVEGGRTYVVGEVRRDGWTQTAPFALLPLPHFTHEVFVSPGETVDGLDFGNDANPGSIVGTKYHDLDGDGGRDAGEPGLPGWTIFLDQDEDGTLNRLPLLEISTNGPLQDILAGVATRFPLAVIDRLGRIADVNVQISSTLVDWSQIELSLVSPAGTRVALVALPTTGGVARDSLILDDQATALQANWATLPAATVRFRPLGLLEELNGELPNGLWQLEFTDHLPIAAGGNGALESWRLTLQLDEPSSTTNDQGNFALSGLPPGDYFVQEEIVSGWAQVDPATGIVRPQPVSIPVEVARGAAVSDIELGNVETDRPAEVRGVVWLDANGDRVQLDTAVGAEPGLPGWIVYLDANRNAVREAAETMTTTGADGSYSFSNLPPGFYTVGFEQPPGWLQSYPWPNDRLFGAPESGSTILVELDPATGRELHRFPIPTGIYSDYSQAMAYDGQSIFVYESVNSRLWQLDPFTGAVIDEDRVADESTELVGDIAALGGRIYLVDRLRDQLVVWDPVADVIERTVDLRAANPAFDFTAIDAIVGAVEPNELLAAVRDFGSDFLVRIDPNTGVFQTEFTSLASSRIALLGSQQLIEATAGGPPRLVFRTREGAFESDVPLEIGMLLLASDGVPMPGLAWHNVFLGPGQTAVRPFGTQNLRLWRNPLGPLDVDRDKFIVPKDALIVINELNNPQYSDGLGRLPPHPAFVPDYLDTSGDDFVTPIDALLVINYLNDLAIGEGEAVGGAPMAFPSASSATGWTEVSARRSSPGAGSAAPGIATVATSSAIRSNQFPTSWSESKVLQFERRRVGQRRNLGVSDKLPLVVEELLEKPS